MAKTPSRILRLFQPEKGWLRHAWPHVQLPAFICTRNPSRWDTSRSRSRSSRGTRSLFVINPLQLTRFAPMEFTVPGDRPEREDYPGGGQERVTCPRHLQFFFSCPGEMPSRASHRPVREKWSKNFLEIDRTRLLRLSGHGWYVHHRVVDKLSSYRPLTGHIFSPPFKYFLQRIRNFRIIPFFLLSLIQLIFFFYLIICLSESEGGILKIDIVNYYYFHFEEKLDFTRTRYPR